MKMNLELEIIFRMRDGKLNKIYKNQVLEIPDIV